MKAIIFATLLTLTFHMVLVVGRKRIQKNKDLISIANLDEKLWKLFSRYIRTKDMDWKGGVICFTCDKYFDYRATDAGHYIPKATSGSYLKYYEKNVHVQCQDCNRWKGGNYAVYKQRLIVKYGLGIIDELKTLRNEPPLTVSDYQQKINYYSHWLKSNSR